METLEAGDPHRIGPYSLTGKLGTAGAGETFAGRSVGGHFVAVTVVPPEEAAASEFRGRFRTGFAAARAVSGEFIRPVVDADPDAPEPWFATTLVHGVPLRQAVHKYGGLPEPALRRLALGLAAALSHIHAAGLIHGAVGPDSVLLAVDGPYIAAFDSAGSIDPGGSSTDDVFDLGATVLFAASGSEQAWDGASADLDAVTSVLPPSLREVIGGCLYPDPWTRPTAEQLIDYLNRQGLPVAVGDWLPAALTADIKSRAAAAPSGLSGGGISRRNLVFGLAGGAFLLGGGAAAAVLSSGGSSPSPVVKRTPRPTATPKPSSTNSPAPIALDAPDATKAWTLTGQSAITCLEASDTVVMVITANATSFLDTSTGKTAFSALNTTNSNGSDDLNSPTTYSGGVFYYLCETADSFNMVAAVDGTTGSVKWATDMAEEDSSGNGMVATYVAVNGNTVFVCGTVDNSSSVNSNVTTGYIRAFDSADGKGLWTVEGADINNVLVPPSGSYLLAASSTPVKKNGQVEMIDAGKQGARGWKISTPNNTEFYFTTGWPMTCYAAGVFFFVGGTGNLVIAVDAATGREKWRQDFAANNGDQVELGSIFTSLDGATVYVPLGGNLIALNSADGTLKWASALVGAGAVGGDNEFNAGLGDGRAAQCSADTVFVTDTAKNLWAIDAATGKARWKYNDPGQPDTGFKWTVGGDRVFIASNLTLTAISAH
jgi:outer membrane protein assembly factor BamB